MGVKSAWLQVGVVDKEAVAQAMAAGLDLVMDVRPLCELLRLNLVGPVGALLLLL